MPRDKKGNRKSSSCLWIVKKNERLLREETRRKSVDQLKKGKKLVHAGFNMKEEREFSFWSEKKKNSTQIVRVGGRNLHNTQRVTKGSRVRCQK